ncbi:hypothetical protein INS49_000412 [Diaporthe citri]|uniref:uncharacterized protein n=1 Tax=Diaporthe citri TaxID=83186 RepID=UPI001C7F2280|nr:uncharacterized protein INS49_000412 [Diaporthe citri]KAG6366236.1 hypothetical protein INS49_000412 [Diaporthe citri]
MDGVQDFNSSDIEFSDHDVAEHLKYGQASIDRMIANAAKDRISPKKTVKQLQYQAVAPGTNQHYGLWSRRFETFREHTLHQSVDVPFTGEDMIRFFDSIIEAYKKLLSYGTSRWSEKDGFEITGHDSARFKAFTAQAVKDKRLTKGMWKGRSWVGFVTLSRMVRVFLEHYVQHGARSFDLVISRSLSIVLVAALGCRAGDIALTQGYTGLEYRNIELYLEEEAPSPAGQQQPQRPRPSIRDLRAVVTIEFAKGHKDTLNDSTVKYLRPLDDLQSIHVCPIALLLVHALRNGLIHGTTVEDVLSRAAARPDLHVEWAYPDRPVVTAIAHGPRRCELDTPGGGQQLLRTTKEMGVLSGMLSRVCTHSLRLGALRDYAHLPKTVSTTLASTDEVRKVAGHTHVAMNRGVTANYIGNLAQEYYNSRAEKGGIQHREAMKRPLSEEEIQQDLDERRRASGGGVEQQQQQQQHEEEGGEDPDVSSSYSLTHTEMSGIQYRVRQKRQKELATSAMPQPPTPRTASNAHLYAAPAPPPPPPPPTAQFQAGQHGLPGAVAGQEAPSTTSSSSSSSLSPSSAAAAAASTTWPNPSGSGLIPNSEELVSLSQVDPALLDEETLEALDVAQADVEALHDAITTHSVPEADTPGANKEEEEGGLPGSTSDDAAEANMEEAARLLLGQGEVQDGAGGPADTTTTTTSSVRTASNPEGWINGFARHNVVKNTCFVSVWKEYSDGELSFGESVGHHSVRGNSRDEPTPYTFHCQRTEGCGYTAIKLSLLQAHEISCSIARVEARREEAQAGDILRCTHPGCRYKTSHGKEALRKHVRRIHKWTPKPCPEPGCDPEKLYETGNAFEAHQSKAHSGRWPSKCPFPGCPSTVEFNAAIGLARKDAVGQADVSCAYVQQQHDVIWVSRSAMLSHTKSTHKMKEEDALELLDREASSEVVTPEEKKVLGLGGGNAKKRDTQRAFAAPAGGKESEDPQLPPPSALDGVQRSGGDDGGTRDAPAKLKRLRVKK